MRKERFAGAFPGNLEPVVLSRRRTGAGGLIEIEPVDSLAFIPNPLPPSLDWRAIKADFFDSHSDCIAALSKLNGLLSEKLDPGMLREAVWRAMWLREAKLSSAIENIHTTTLEMVVADRAIVDERGENALQALNAVKAIQAMIESELPLCVRLIKQAHRVLMTGPVRGADKRLGEFRVDPTYLGQEGFPERARFVPPPSDARGEVIARCMSDLERFINTADPVVPPLFRVALTHYQFESIHPFADGNGRIGRALIVAQLCREGLLIAPGVSISAYAAARKREYADRLFAVSADGDWSGWFGFVLSALTYEAGRVFAFCERLLGWRSTVRGGLRERGVPIRRLGLLDHLLRNPVVSVKAVEEICDVTYPTARGDIDDFVEHGLLRPVDQDARWGKLWYAPAVIDLIEQETSAGEDPAG